MNLQPQWPLNGNIVMESKFSCTVLSHDHSNICYISLNDTLKSLLGRFMTRGLHRHLGVCVCVWERERERETGRECVFLIAQRWASWRLLTCGQRAGNRVTGDNQRKHELVHTLPITNNHSTTVHTQIKNTHFSSNQQCLFIPVVWFWDEMLS